MLFLHAYFTHIRMLSRALECNFFVAPRASILGDLLALSDFYWPQADGPVLVSIPAKGQYLSYKFLAHWATT